MKYLVVLTPSDEGVAASVVGLPGCHSQGSNETEAMDSIGEAIREYLAVQAELWAGHDVREIEVEA